MRSNGNREMLEQPQWHVDDTDASFILRNLKLQQQHQPWFQLEHYRVLTRGGVPGDATVEASIKLHVDGMVSHVVRESKSAVHALDLALREALASTYSRLDEMVIADYRAHVVDSDAAVGAHVCVQLRIWDCAHRQHWSAGAIAGDIVCATVIALVDAFEFKRWVDVNNEVTRSRRATLVSRSI
jgi:2-isopropylmalate synthase